MRACLSIREWEACIWESSCEPRSLCLSGFEWKFLGISNWISVCLCHHLFCMLILGKCGVKDGFVNHTSDPVCLFPSPLPLL